MIDVLGLRSQAETLLADLIGTYTYVTELGSEITPALQVDDGTIQDLAPNTITGLEVVIRPAVDSPLQRLMRGYVGSYKTTITLKQWDISGNTLEASERLMSGLPNIESIGPRVMRNSTLDSIETRTITLSDSFFALRRN